MNLSEKCKDGDFVKKLAIHRYDLLGRIYLKNHIFIILSYRYSLFNSGCWWQRAVSKVSIARTNKNDKILVITFMKYDIRIGVQGFAL